MWFISRPLNDKNVKLERGLTLWQATAINMIDMVGIGPFVTIPLIVAKMHGSTSIWAWLLGALLAYMDGMVWAQLGAKWPEAGGSYVFLQRLYSHLKIGNLMAFLFIWQTTIQAPLVIASGAIGFAQYFSYVVPVSDIQQKMVSGSLVVLLVALLYRDIKSIGKISVVLWIITGGTILWLIGSGALYLAHNQPGSFSLLPAIDHLKQVAGGHFPGFDNSTAFFGALGFSTIKATYSYLGYYNVCHLGAEIKNPGKNIPRSILISITGIAILYISMQTVILQVLPWQQVAGSKYIASIYFEHIYNSQAIGMVATALVLVIGLASLFSAILGYSRIPYAAALNGDFFSVFARVHPRYKFPHISLLAIGGLGFVFSLLFKLGDVISAILMMRILIQFVSQAVGLILYHYHRGKEERPYKMPLFPLPAIISIFIWLFLFYTNERRFQLYALDIIVSGIAAWFIRGLFTKKNDIIKVKPGNN